MLLDAILSSESLPATFLILTSDVVSKVTEWLCERAQM